MFTEPRMEYTFYGHEFAQLFEENTAAPLHETTYGGRFLIGSDTPINKGVYLVGSVSHGAVTEAIVVDDTLVESRKLLEVFQTFVNILYQYPEPQRWNYVLDIARNVTMTVLPYNAQKVEAFVNAYPAGTLINLSAFLEGGFGICRHQALLVAYLVDRLMREKHIPGKVCVDRSSIVGRGGHAWARYTSPQRKVFIVDAANNLNVTALEKTGIAPWDYTRTYETIENGKIKTNHFKKLLFKLKRLNLGFKK